MEAFHPYVVFILGLGVLFFATAIFGLYWAIKSGQFDKLEEGSRVVFTGDEPEGYHTDFFPGEAEKSAAKIRAVEEKKDNFKEI